jgi:nucleoside-diphosphate-sugar epimerase
MNRLFIFGLGYTGGTIARRLRAQGWSVGGTIRDARTIENFRRDGIEAVDFADAAAAFRGASHVLSTAQTGPSGDPVLAAYRDAIEALKPIWIGYLSTTGIYGDAGGGWVDEETPPRPAQERTRRRVEAELAWRALDPAAHVFRLAGIYGPGRSQLDDLRDGSAKRYDKPGQVFSRIHVEDIATVVAASMTRPDPGRIYNVCDDEPASPIDLIAYAATLIGVAPPPILPFDQVKLTPMAASFYAENRRVRNERIKKELGVRLAYPTYREGLSALARA